MVELLICGYASFSESEGAVEKEKGRIRALDDEPHATKRR